MLASSQPFSPRAERTLITSPPVSYRSSSSQQTIVPALPSPPESPPRSLRPSMSIPMHWLTRNASSKDSVSNSSSKRASDTKHSIRSVDISRPQRNGVLGAGAKVVRTPDEALRESRVVERAGVLGSGATIVRTPDDALRESSVCLTYQHSRSTSTDQLTSQLNSTATKRSESAFRAFQRHQENAYADLDEPDDEKHAQVAQYTPVFGPPPPPPERSELSPRPTVSPQPEARLAPAARLPTVQQEERPEIPRRPTLTQGFRSSTVEEEEVEDSSDRDEAQDEVERDLPLRADSPTLPPLPPSEPSSSVYSVSPRRVPSPIMLPPIRSRSPPPSLISNSQDDIEPVPPLPANISSSPPPPNFRPILMSEVPEGVIDPSKIIVTLETCTTTYRTTMETLCSRPSHLATYINSLFKRTKTDCDSASLYSTLSDDMSTYHHHLTGMGLLPHSSFSVHIFLDRPSAPYNHILNYLRSPEDSPEYPETLPHAVRLRASTNPRLEALLELRDEARYLGLDGLHKLCTDELRLRQPSRRHTRGLSISSSASMSVRSLAGGSVGSLHTLLERVDDDARPSSGSTYASGRRSGSGSRSSSDLKSIIKNSVRATVASVRAPSTPKPWQSWKHTTSPVQSDPPPAGWV